MMWTVRHLLRCESGTSTFAISRISARSFSRVWRIMNSRSGRTACVTADSMVIWLSRQRLDAVLIRAWNAGAMVNSVRNSARLTSTMLGGVSCMPKAWRSIDNTMIVRVNDVIAMTTAGSTASSVSSIMMRSASETDPPFAPDVERDGQRRDACSRTEQRCRPRLTTAAAHAAICVIRARVMAPALLTSPVARHRRAPARSRHCASR